MAESRSLQEIFQSFLQELKVLYPKNKPKFNAGDIASTALKHFQPSITLSDNNFPIDYDFEKFLAHLSYCFTTIKTFHDQSQEKSKMERLVELCFLSEKIDINMFIQRCQQAEAERDHILFSYLSSQVLSIFHCPTVELEQDIRSLCSKLKSEKISKAEGKQSTALELRELNESEYTEIRDVLEKLIYSQRSLKAFHDINNCFEAAQDIEDLNKTREHVEKIFASKLFILPNKIPNLYGMTDIQGNVYLSQILFDLPKEDEKEEIEPKKEEEKREEKEEKKENVEKKGEKEDETAEKEVGEKEMNSRTLLTKVVSTFHEFGHVKRMQSTPGGNHPLIKTPEKLGKEAGGYLEKEVLETQYTLNISEDDAEKILQSLKEGRI